MSASLVRTTTDHREGACKYLPRILTVFNSCLRFVSQSQYMSMVHLVCVIGKNAFGQFFSTRDKTFPCTGLLFMAILSLCKTIIPYIFVNFDKKFAVLPL